MSKLLQQLLATQADPSEDKRRRFEGVVTSDSLLSCLRGLARDDDGRIEQAFVTDIEPARADAPLADVMSLAAESPWPVPVVDDEGRYVGTISKAALLQTLNRSDQGEE